MNISDSECLLSQCVKELIECRDGTACLPNFSYENICNMIKVQTNSIAVMTFLNFNSGSILF